MGNDARENKTARLALRWLSAKDELLSVQHQQVKLTEDVHHTLKQILEEIRVLNRLGRGQTALGLPSEGMGDNKDAHDNELLAKGSGGLGGRISTDDYQLRIIGGGGGSASVSWGSSLGSGSFSVQGGKGGDAAVGSHGPSAAHGRGGSVKAEARRTTANRSGSVSERESGQ